MATGKRFPVFETCNVCKTLHVRGWIRHHPSRKDPSKWWEVCAWCHGNYWGEECAIMKSKLRDAEDIIRKLQGTSIGNNTKMKSGAMSSSSNDQISEIAPAAPPILSMPSIAPAAPPIVSQPSMVYVAPTAIPMPSIALSQVAASQTMVPGPAIDHQPNIEVVQPQKTVPWLPAGKIVKHNKISWCWQDCESHNAMLYSDILISWCRNRQWVHHIMLLLPVLWSINRLTNWSCTAQNVIHWQMIFVVLDAIIWVLFYWSYHVWFIMSCFGCNYLSTDWVLFDRTCMHHCCINFPYNHVLLLACMICCICISCLRYPHLLNCCLWFCVFVCCCFTIISSHLALRRLKAMLVF